MEIIIEEIMYRCLQEADILLALQSEFSLGF